MSIFSKLLSLAVKSAESTAERRAARGAVASVARPKALQRNLMMAEIPSPPVKARLRAPAPTGTLNVGLAASAKKGVPGRPRDLAVKQVESALRDVGRTPRGTATRQSGSEPTAIIDVKPSLSVTDLRALSATLGQDAIAQMTGRRGSAYEGILSGPREREWGGAFNPQYFIDRDGLPLEEAPIPTAADLAAAARAEEVDASRAASLAIQRAAARAGSLAARFEKRIDVSDFAVGGRVRKTR